MTLQIITVDELASLRHGFFTRKGGASDGVFSGLNCGLGSSDQTEMVQINRTRAAEAMGGSLAELITVHQTHSADVLALDGPIEGPLPRLDGLVTATPGLILGVLTADCAPVLFADPENGVIGAAHAGWKGALGGILEATLDAMEGLGAARSQITAAIGPTISQTSYEVGPEFFERFQDEDDSSSRFFSGGSDDRMHFDLPSYALDRLRQAGVGQALWTRHCTYQDPDLFFSYRRSTHQKEADYGRMLSTIRL